jgi:anti-sigma factor (TIGR02949 family)
MIKDDPCAKGGPSGSVDCATALQQLWEYLDGELIPERMQAMRMHLARCSRCYPQYDFEKAFLAALSNCQCTTCAPNDVRCRIMEALRRAGFAPEQKTTA